MEETIKDMKKNLLALALLLFVFGCKKSGNTKDEEQNYKGCVVESAVTTDGNGVVSNTINYTYDDKGRVVKKTELSDNSKYLQIITYEHLDKMIKVKWEDGYIGTTPYVDEGQYELDEKGRITKGIRVDGAIDEIYNYDVSGYLISVEEVPKSFVNYTYANENLVQIDERYYTYGQELLTSDRFDIAKTAGGIAFGAELGYYGYLGKRSKNLIKTHTHVHSYGTVTVNYAFTKDAKGNIIKMVETTGTSTKTTNYTYKCF